MVAKCIRDTPKQPRRYLACKVVWIALGVDVVKRTTGARSAPAAVWLLAVVRLLFGPKFSLDCSL
ncbi:hypothetical protein FEAC_05720 [Ferrimicrobium acidiphilum DSM 19497]|uniref:Uncharacterized protein n=1 Tax=Ferrimicrobium acidiphilum DSM 19497 TaxID=1121877 RepID=A0A0D8FX29_9ACTN|nr:hypothetical protein FEAC_05720 [Ferrimicrobium acidiphilum DSM 19497]